MNVLVLRASVRHTLRHPALIALSVLGIALGVGVTLGVDLANESARRAFDLSMERVTGAATHQIAGGPRGVGETLFRDLRVRHGVRNTAPVVEGHVRVGAETLQVLGIDPVSEVGFRQLTGEVGNDAGRRLMVESGAVLVSSKTASRLGLQIDNPSSIEVNGRQVPLLVVGLLEPRPESAVTLDGLLVTDIATAQDWFARPGYLTRIDLRLPPREEGRRRAARIRALLPPGAHLEYAAGRGRAMEEMTEAFRLNLTALSLLALLVGMFLIYNTMSFAVLQRRGLLGDLRVLGVTRAAIFAVTIGEAMVLGLIGTALGFGLGMVLGQGLVGLVTRTINDLYFVLTVNEYFVTPVSFAKGLVLGLVASVVAALVPAFEAAYSQPRTVQARSSIESRARYLTPRLALLSVLCLASAWALLRFSERSIALGFAALFLVVAAAVLCTPLLVTLVVRGGRIVLAGKVKAIPLLVMRGISASQSRTGVATAALMVAVAASVGVGVMVSSFRETVAEWLDSALQADVYVTLPGSADSGGSLPPSLLSAMRAMEGVAEMSTGHFVAVNSRRGPIRLNALQPTTQSQEGYRFKESVGTDVWGRFAAGEGVLVSEPLAYRLELRAGEAIELQTAYGFRSFVVAGVYYDYRSDRGAMVMHRSLYTRLWNDVDVSAAGLYLRAGFAAEKVMDEVRRLAVDSQPVAVQDSGTIRTESLRIFDRTFTITHVLRVQVLFVAFVGILSALMALQLERGKELGVLRAIGFTPRELKRLVTAQTGFIGLIAGLAAIPLGLAIAVGLIEVINRRSFGWTIHTVIPVGDLLLALALAVAAALIAGMYPAWKMSRTPPAQALREE